MSEVTLIGMYLGVEAKTFGLFRIGERLGSEKRDATLLAPCIFGDQNRYINAL